MTTSRDVKKNAMGRLAELTGRIVSVKKMELPKPTRAEKKSGPTRAAF